MEEEMVSLREKNTWELVPKPAGVKILDSKWVYKLKFNPAGEIDRFKARLVVRGFQQQFQVDFFETFSTVSRYESIRLILAMAQAQNLKIEQFDVRTAFLNGELEEDLYMAQPLGFSNGNPNEVCHLLRPLYGLKQAPKNWRNRIEAFLATCGLFPFNSDSCVFSGTISKANVILILYVDDGLILSDKSAAIKEILYKLQAEFETTAKHPETFVGIEIKRTEECMYLSQIQYTTAILEKFGMIECRSASVPMQPNTQLLVGGDPDPRIPYRELIGALLFLARVTRPDICYAVTKLAQFNQCHSQEHWKAAKVILRYLATTPNLGLSYPTQNAMTLSIYTDSDYAGDHNDRKSTSGFAAFLGQSLISWCSQKQEVISLSSTESEYIALGFGAREGVWLRALLTEMKYPQDTTPVFVDNTSAIRLVENPEFHKRTKHIDVKYHYVRELNESGQINTQYVSTQDQLADIFTKPLGKNKFEENRSRLGIVNINQSNTPTHGGLSNQADANQSIKKREKNGIGKVGWTLLFLMVIAFPTLGVHITNSQPVLWRASKTPIISGYDKVYLRLDLYSPCLLLTEDVVHTDNLEQAKKMCKEMYQKRFMDELEKMCPREGNYLTHRIQKRFVVIGTLIVVGIIMAAGVSGVALAATNTVRVGEVEDITAAQQKALDSLAQEVNLTELAHGKLRNDFNRLVHDYELHTKDYKEFKDKAPTVQFILSSIVSGLTMSSTIFKGATREWKKGKVSSLFMDYMNITLPCGDTDCPLDLATAQKCVITNDGRSINMEISIPKINPKMHLVESDSFDFMVRTWNQTCRVIYDGPTNAVLGPTGCPVALNIHTNRIYELIYSSSDACLADKVNHTANNFFHVKQCRARVPGDERDFIQVKSHHGFLHIYCWGSNITIEGQQQRCPSEVFVLPVGTRFTVNDRDFVGSIVNVHHQESPDPLFTLRTNHYLKPQLDYQDLLTDPLINHKFQYTKVDIKDHGHDHWMLFIIIISLIVILFVLIGIILRCYFCNRTITVAVEKRASFKQQSPDHVEISPN